MLKRQLNYTSSGGLKKMRKMIRALRFRSDNESRGSGMNTSVSPIRVGFDEDSFWVELSDGRVLGVPLAWFPRLLNASQQQREQLRLSTRGLHWEALDED